MKKILLLLSVVVIVFSSCQKEIDSNDGSAPGNGSAGTKLVKVISHIGADSVVSLFSYNGANRISDYFQSGVFNGIAITADLRPVRNAAGVITSTVVKTSALAQFGLDSVVNFHTYDAAASRYKYSISRITIFGTTETDSVVYSYNSGGMLITAIDYTDDGTGYVPSTKEDYTYNGANLFTTKSYSYDISTNSYSLDKTVTNEYDTKINPLLFPADAPILGMDVFYPANNPVKTTTVETSGPSTTVRNVVYTYTTGNRPLSSVSSGNGVTASVNSYYYQ